MSQKSSLPQVTQFVSGALSSDKELTIDGYIRQVESGGSPYVAINAGFKMGF